MCDGSELPRQLCRRSGRHAVVATGVGTAHHCRSVAARPQLPTFVVECLAEHLSYIACSTLPKCPLTWLPRRVEFRPAGNRAPPHPNSTATDHRATSCGTVRTVNHEFEHDVAAASYWGRTELLQTVLDALSAAGKDVDHLDVEDLAVTDHFHNGGRLATLKLAERAGLVEPTSPPRRVLDVGGGLGGPARTLASLYGCDVTVVDITPSYVDVARELTRRAGLESQVRHQVADALNLAFGDGEFDMVWTQNSGMNIADKASLYAGFSRVLRSGGTLAFQEPMAGQNSPPHYPLMWADDASMSFLGAPGDMRELILGHGFVERSWDVVTEAASSAAAMPPPAHSVQRLIMGEQRLAAIVAAGRRNLAEDRFCTVHGVFTKQ